MLARWTVGLAMVGALCACGTAESPGAAAKPAPAPAPAPAPPSKPAGSPGDNPCASPEPRTITLEAGVIEETPWGLEITYAIDEDEKRGPGYMFLLRHGKRRWELRRDNRNWNAELTWRGFCWRGGERPEERASRLQIEMAPVCKDGKLVELGGCGDALASAN